MVTNIRHRYLLPRDPTLKKLRRRDCAPAAPAVFVGVRRRTYGLPLAHLQQRLRTFQHRKESDAGGGGSPCWTAPAGPPRLGLS